MPTNSIQLLASLLALIVLAVTSAHAADTDSDGVEDDADNCTLVINPDQRDTDVDGFGNFCDPDFNNDQVVNFADLDEFKTAFFSDSEEHDLNGDDFVNFADLIIVKQFFFGMPGPGAPDVDGDGVPLHLDRCDESPPDAIPLREGCSSFELAENPGQFTDNLGVMLAEVTALVSGDPVIGFVEDNLVTARLNLEAGVQLIRGGDICIGTVGLFGSTSRLGDAMTQLSGVIALTEEQLGEERPFTVFECDGPFPHEGCEFGADHADDDNEVMEYLRTEALLADLRGQMQQTALLFETACEDSATDRSATGTVLKIESDRSRLFLDDGTYVGIVDGLDVPPDIYPGRTVSVRGTAYGGAANSSIHAGLITGIGAQGGLAGFLTYEACVRLRFAPFQAFPPLTNGPYELHEPSGYRYPGNVHRLEHGMRLGAKNIPFCGSTLGPFSVRYSLNLTLQFVNRNTNLTETWVLATEMSGSDTPVIIPPLVKPSTDAILFVTHIRQSCEVINLPGPARVVGNSYFICSEQEEYGSEQLTLRMLDHGDYCTAQYNQTEFMLEEVSQTTFAPTSVIGKTTNNVSPDGGVMSVVGRGYEVYGANSSSYPSLKDISEGEQFAVHEHDCASTPGLLYVAGSCGTTQASALRWPRLAGNRNGQPFSYSCRLPNLIRDLVDPCIPPPHSYYKLPFFGGNPTWLMGQGNNGNFTHNGNQAFAFDFVADNGTTVRAARPGRVSFVRENQTGNSYYDPGCSNCMANAVNITHGDGTIGQYFHFLTNGVSVNVGQIVKRGDPIGSVGNTGFTTDPHVHFHAVTSGGPTIPLRFESLDNGNTTPPDACYIPDRNDPLDSDNN